MLRWAEQLPQFRGGPIAHLQEIRKRQLQDQQELVDRIRLEAPPEVTLTSFCLAEVFFVEDLSMLEKQLQRIDTYGQTGTILPRTSPAKLYKRSFTA